MVWGLNWGGGSNKVQPDTGKTDLETLANIANKQNEAIQTLGNQPHKKKDSNRPRVQLDTGAGHDLSKAVLKQSEHGVEDSSKVMNSGMEDMAQIMALQSIQQFQMAKMKVIVSMAEAIGKEIKKSPDAIKNMAG
jgi:hypothetical protein